MSNKKAWLVFGIVLVAAIIIAAISGYYFGAGKNGGAGSEQEGIQNAADEQQAGTNMTREEVPPGTVVPDRDSEVANNIAVPEAVAEAAPGVDSKNRQFRVEVRGGTFVPDTVIINSGDIARITFVATDGNYDLVQPDYGFSLDLPQGEERLLEGHFGMDGKYLFYCPSCGGPESGPKGYIIVTP